MQKELRQRSAALRRQQLQEQQEEKQKMTKMGSRENSKLFKDSMSLEFHLTKIFIQWNA